MFPCVPRTKKPLTKHGFQDATKNDAQIRAWWKKTPTANVGVATGEASGTTVLDVDVKPWKNKRGDLTLDALVKQHGDLPLTVTQQTWSGGLQLVFAYVPGVRIDAEKKLGQRLDIRGEGGYVVVPPSVVQEDGRTGTYTWVRSPFEHLAVMPP